MTAPPKLDDLRQRIDEIDERLHDLLMERATVVEAIGAAKRVEGGHVLRPGREAEVLRRLLRRHRGVFPRNAVVRMWREMFAAHVAIQDRFAVAVHLRRESPGLWDLARDHWGSATTLLSYGSSNQVIRAVTEGLATVGVLPMPQEGEADPWWAFLASADEATPRIVARLPFGSRGNAREGGDALAIAKVPIEETGADRSFLVFETREDVSRARLIAALGGVGLACAFIGSHPVRRQTLAEVEGLVTQADPRLRQLSEQLGDAADRVLPIGGYAAPLTTELE